jgi:hypothetical protein
VRGEELSERHVEGETVDDPRPGERIVLRLKAAMETTATCPRGAAIFDASNVHE